MRFVFVLLTLVACGRKPVDAEPAPGAPPSAAAAITATRSASPPPRERFDAAEVVVPSGKSVLHIAWSLPSGTAINDDAPFTVKWASSDGLVTPPGDIRGTGKAVAAGFDVPLELMEGAAGGLLAGDIDLVVCDVATHAVCVPLRRRLELTFAATKGGSPGRVSLPLPQAAPSH